MTWKKCIVSEKYNYHVLGMYVNAKIMSVTDGYLCFGIIYSIQDIERFKIAFKN